MTREQGTREKRKEREARGQERDKRDSVILANGVPTRKARGKSQIPTPIQQYKSYVVLILAIPYTLTMRSPIALAM
jgi:hypothetical protein